MRSSRLPPENGGIAGFRRLRIGKDVRRVGTLVDRRNADLGQPDRLRARRPRGRGSLEPADPLDMRVRPPTDQVLGPEHPGLRIGAVGDRRACLRAPIGRARVVPVEGLPAGDAGAQVVEVIGAARLGKVGVVRAVSPVADRRVEIDADRVDRRVRPQRVEREAHLGAAVAHMGAVFGPIGRVGDLRLRGEHGAHFGGKRAELRDRRINTGCGAHARQPARARCR